MALREASGVKNPTHWGLAVWGLAEKHIGPSDLRGSNKLVPTFFPVSSILVGFGTLPTKKGVRKGNELGDLETLGGLTLPSQLTWKCKKALPKRKVVFLQGSAPFHGIAGGRVGGLAGSSHGLGGSVCLDNLGLVSVASFFRGNRLQNTTRYASPKQAPYVGTITTGVLLLFACLAKMGGFLLVVLNHP